MSNEFDGEELPPDIMFVGFTAPPGARRPEPRRGQPESKNPEDYPRAVEVEDHEILMNFAQMAITRDEYTKKTAEAQALAERLQVLETKLQAQRTEIFYQMRHRYPEITKDPAGRNGQVGWRKNGEVYYFVGWNAD